MSILHLWRLSLLSRINLAFVFLVLGMLLATIVQADLLPYLSIDQAVLNIILILSILFIFQKRNLFAFYLSLLAGVILDINFGIGFGPYLISYLIIFGLVYLVQNMLLKEEAFVFFVAAVLFGTIVFDASLIAIVNIAGYSVSLLQFWQVILKEMAFNVSVSIFIFALFNYYLKNKFPSSEIKLSERL